MKRFISIKFACAGLAAGLLALSGQNAYAGGGVVDAATAALQPAVVKTIAPSFTFANSHHSMSGVALRNRGSGTIHMRGVPANARLIRAYLYWNFADRSTVGRSWTRAQLNGHAVVGRKTADNPDLCWSTLGTHTYRADVTQLLSRRPINGDYTFTMTLPANVFTTGEHPWLTAGPTTLKVNGAHILVVYNNGVAGSTMIYDALSATASIGVNATYTLTHAAQTGAGTFSMAGADGQLNAGPAESGKFNNVAFVPATGHWDGGSGLPSPQLYDVHSNPVTLSGVSSVVSYINSGDCWAPTTFVVDK